MKSAKLLVAIFLAMIISSQAKADGIVEAAKLAAQACIHEFSGQSAKNSFLLDYGFKQRGRNYVKTATVLGLSGHTDRASITIRRDSCRFQYGTNRGAQQAHDAFVSVFRDSGFKEQIVKYRNWQHPAFVINGASVGITGSTGSANSSYYTDIIASIER